MNYYESQYQKLLLDAGDALSTLKLYPKSLPDIPKWDTAVGEAFLTLEELRKVVGTKFPSFTYLIDSFAVSVKTKFLRGLNAVEKLEPETARRSAARLLPVLNETEDGKILALSAKPLIDLHALKATNKLTGGSGFAHWDSLESAAKRAASSAARLVKEVEKELPGSVPAVESHFKAVGMEIEQGFAQFVERWEKKGIPGVSTIARASSSRLLDATEAAAAAPLNRWKAIGLVGTVAAGLALYLTSSRAKGEDLQTENTGQQSPVIDATRKLQEGPRSSNWFESTPDKVTMPV